MKKQNLETSLKRAYEYGDGGKAECLHAARPRIRNLAAVVEKLREMAKGWRE